jgi:hypothetical protein
LWEEGGGEMKPFILSSGKKCPRCGCDSLEEYQPLEPSSFEYDTHFHCVALCGMLFGLRRRKTDTKIEIGYNDENEGYLEKRFGLTPPTDKDKGE